MHEGGRLTLFPGAGHVSYLDNHGQFMAALGLFRDAIAPTRPRRCTGPHELDGEGTCQSTRKKHQNHQQRAARAHPARRWAA